MSADPPPRPDPAAHDRRPADTFEGLLAAARGGDRAAFDRVFALVYDELRRVASRQAMRFGGGGTLSTTALVHEVYLKLAGDSVVPTNDRVHFFALAARAMRQILIDHARRGDRKKRGGGEANLPLERFLDTPGELAAASSAEELLAVDHALERLAVVDAELERLVEWRFFGGLTFAEIADLTGTSERTLKRDWAVARLFLLRELAGNSDLPPPA